MHGPKTHHLGEFAYQNTIDGDLSKLIGEQTITFKCKTVVWM